ncbi:MAG TPA: ABC transporter substrate-binding protein [Tepidisphaeraceae bacterium]|jgi:peptide/nickel transport system substrate-binding protein|nr:ABC transporter substrate-binding protein [Tepidisphaeraceae bacterium]
MENRFGFKDLVLATLVILLIVVVWLGMVQLDRVFVALKDIRQNNSGGNGAGGGEEINRRLSAIERMLNDAGPATLRPAHSTTNPAEEYPHGDPFANIKEAEKQPDFARGDWLIDNLGTKLKTLTYPVASDLYSAWIQARVLDSLIYQDPDTLEYRPQLARDWNVSADGMVLTFLLRRGVLFSDGTPLTADDVVYSYEFLNNPKINCPRIRGYLENIKSVQKKDEDTIVFTMKKTYFQSLDLCGTLNIVSREFMSQFKEEEINTNPGLILGTGPYRTPDPQSWRPGKKIELVRNELYWGVAPPIDRCVYLEVEEEAAEETMFDNGELDVFATQPEQYKRLLADPNTAKHANHYEYDSPMTGYFYIAWNEKRAGKDTLFTDKRVRRAMTMLTDRQRICHDVYLDYATPTSGPFAASSQQADPSIKLWPYDVAAAKALLEEVGFKDRDGSGVLKNDRGEPFKFRLTYGANNATFERVVLLLKDTYAKAGVTLEQDPVDWPVLQKKLDQRDFDAIALGWGGTPESDLYQEFDSSQIADQGDNFMSYSDPKLDAVVEKARITVDKPARMTLWHEAHAILHEDQPYTFLCSRKSLRFMDKRIENVRRSKLGLNYIYVFSMPNPWYVPKAMQRYSAK